MALTELESIAIKMGIERAGLLSVRVPGGNKLRTERFSTEQEAAAVLQQVREVLAPRHGHLAAGCVACAALCAVLGDDQITEHDYRVLELAGVRRDALHAWFNSFEGDADLSDLQGLHRHWMELLRMQTHVLIVLIVLVSPL